VDYEWRAITLSIIFHPVFTLLRWLLFLQTLRLKASARNIQQIFNLVGIAAFFIYHWQKNMKLFFACLLLLSAKILIAQALPDSSEKRIFDNVEQEAEFPGGIPEWIKFLTKKLERFNPADNGAPIGKYECIAQFIVTKDGTLNNITMLTKMGYGMEEEAKKCLSQSPKWVPALQNGRNVNAYRKQPITFMVEDADIDIQTKIPYTLLANEKNWITISVRKVKPENLRISIDDGLLQEGNEGDFMINPANKQRINFTIHNAGRKNAVVGKVSLNVMAKK
jgi:hypothetical protein